MLLSLWPAINQVNNCLNSPFASLWEHMEGIALNLAWWWTPTTFSTDYILVVFCWCSEFRCKYDLELRNNRKYKFSHTSKKKEKEKNTARLKALIVICHFASNPLVSGAWPALSIRHLSASQSQIVWWVVIVGANWSHTGGAGWWTTRWQSIGLHLYAAVVTVTAVCGLVKLMNPVLCICTNWSPDFKYIYT